MLRTAVGCLLTALLGWAAAAAHAQSMDVRLVIDVSGSMRTGDPEYLRQDVLNGVLDVLPDGSRAGVWTFGGNATCVVPHGAVDAAWRRAARAARTSIGSAAARTNLRAALAAAAWDASQQAPDRDRRIVLVSDARVDLGPDAAANAAERRTIVEQLLPRLRAAGIRIDTLALSQNADTGFLEELADATDGRSGRAESVADVRTFLAHTIATPLPRMGSFDVPTGVEELTLFAAAPHNAFTLMSPDGRTIDATAQPQGVRWRDTGDSVLITMSAPEPGRWRYAPADVRPNVWRDLALDIHPNDSTEARVLRVVVTDAGVPLQEPRLRDVATLDAQMKTLYGTQALTVTAAADDAGASYDVEVGSPLTSDDEVALHLIAPTFERSRRYVERVAHPFDVEFRGVDDGNAAASLQVNGAAADRATLRVLGSVTAPNGRVSLAVGARQADGAWLLPVQRLAPTVDVKLKFLFDDAAGRAVQIDSDPIALTLPIDAPKHVGLDEQGHIVVDPVRPPPSPAPEPSVTTTDAPSSAAAAADAPIAAPTHRVVGPWEWFAMLAITLATVGSLVLLAWRSRHVSAGGDLAAALEAHRAAMTAFAAKGAELTTT